jgi:hypothetical protein
MSHRTSIRSAGLAAAMVASLVIVPVASAYPDEQGARSTSIVGPQLSPDRADRLGVINQGPIAVPDRVARLGVIAQGPIGAPDRVHTSVILSQGAIGAPDRADRLGTAGGPGPVAVVTVPSSSSGSFDWSEATVVAAAIFALALLATIGALALRRRNGPTAVAS